MLQSVKYVLDIKWEKQKYRNGEGSKPQHGHVPLLVAHLAYVWFHFHVPFFFQEKLSKGNPCTLGSYLGMVDPWYDSNIKSLGSIMTNLAKMVCCDSKHACI